MPFTFLDVPYDDDEASVMYLADQLRQLADNLSKLTGKPFCEEKLREIIKNVDSSDTVLSRNLKKVFQQQK